MLEKKLYLLSIVYLISTAVIGNNYIDGKYSTPLHATYFPM